MGKTSTEVKTKYNLKTYKEYRLRIRKDSDTFKKIERFRDTGNSINGLLTDLLDGKESEAVKLFKKI